MRVHFLMLVAVSSRRVIEEFVRSTESESRRNGITLPVL